MKNFRYILLLLPLLFLACTPQQRINHIIRRHPDVIAFDSTRFTSTIILPGHNIPLKFSIDSIISLRPGDTIRVDSTSVQVTITQANDSININVHIRPDTVSTDTTLVTGTITAQVTPRRKFSRFDWILVILSVITILAVLRYLFPRNK